MVYVLTTLVVLSFIFKYRLLKEIKQLQNKNLNLVSALNALNGDLTNFQAGISRDLEHTNRIIDSNFTRLKRVDKKVDVNKRDIMNSLPIQIRKTIGHIEFAQPLDKK
jgi:hypothetical protein